MPQPPPTRRRLLSGSHAQPLGPDSPIQKGRRLAAFYEGQTAVYNHLTVAGFTYSDVIVPNDGLKALTFSEVEVVATPYEGGGEFGGDVGAHEFVFSGSMVPFLEGQSSTFQVPYTIRVTVGVPGAGVSNAATLTLQLDVEYTATYSLSGSDLEYYDTGSSFTGAPGDCALGVFNCRSGKCDPENPFVCVGDGTGCACGYQFDSVFSICVRDASSSGCRRCSDENTCIDCNVCGYLPNQQSEFTPSCSPPDPEDPSQDANTLACPDCFGNECVGDGCGCNSCPCGFSSQFDGFSTFVCRADAETNPCSPPPPPPLSCDCGYVPAEGPDPSTCVPSPTLSDVDACQPTCSPPATAMPASGLNVVVGSFASIASVTNDPSNATVQYTIAPERGVLLELQAPAATYIPDLNARRPTGDCSASDLSLGYSNFWFTRISGWLYVPVSCKVRFLLGHSPDTFNRVADEGFYVSIGDLPIYSFTELRTAIGFTFNDQADAQALDAGWHPLSIIYYNGDARPPPGRGLFPELRLVWGFTGMNAFMSMNTVYFSASDIKPMNTPTEPGLTYTCSFPPDRRRSLLQDTIRNGTSPAADAVRKPPSPLQSVATAPPPPGNPATPEQQALAQLDVNVTIPNTPHTTYVVMSAVNSTATGGLRILDQPDNTTTSAAPAPDSGSTASAAVGASALNSLNDLLSVFGDTPASAALERAVRIAFWVSIVIGAALVVHVLLIVAFRCFHRHPPALLEFPRLELFLLLFMVMPIGQCAAQLIASGSRPAMIGGWCIFVFGCVAFLSFGAVVVYKSVHHQDSRKAHWVVPTIEPEAEGGWFRKLWERCVAVPLAGRPYPEGEWVQPVQQRRHRFIQRHGVLFEDNKGPPYRYKIAREEGCNSSGTPSSEGDPKVALAVEESRHTRAAGMNASEAGDGRPAATCMSASERTEWSQHYASQGDHAAAAAVLAGKEPALPAQPGAIPSAAHMSASERQEWSQHHASQGNHAAAAAVLQGREAASGDDTAGSSGSSSPKGTALRTAHLLGSIKAPRRAVQARADDWEAVPERQLFQVAGVPVGPSELRTYATLLWVGKSLVVGYVLVSLSTKGGIAGVITVVVLATFWLLYSRLLLPMNDRLEQGIEVFAAAGDVVTFACALALLLSPVDSADYSLIIGQLMIASQGGAIWLYIVTRPWSWWPVVKLALGSRLRLFSIGASLAQPSPAIGGNPAAAAVAGAQADTAAAAAPAAAAADAAAAAGSNCGSGRWSARALLRATSGLSSMRGSQRRSGVRRSSAPAPPMPPMPEEDSQGSWNTNTPQTSTGGGSSAGPAPR